jgi:S-(hydroxymethyl)glutathione dehydrogenase/alcohol dehydrogenase
MKTLAAILVEQRQPLVIDEVELPALRYGHVLVEIESTRICGSQLGEIDGAKGADKYLPHLLGHEAGGIVREIGSEVTQVKTGDHVVVHWRPGRGIQALPVMYRWGNRTVNAGNLTTFQQFTVVSENRLTVIPADVEFETAALLADTLTTGFGAITREARVELGESVAVVGVGGIGLGAVLAASLAGAYPVIAADIHDHKLAAARAFGATHTINTNREPFADAVRALLGGPADVVIDGTGRPAVLEQAWAATGPKGRLVLIGVMPHDAHFSFNTLPLHYGKVLTGTEGGASRPAEDIPRYLRLLAAKGIDPRGMISHRCVLADINAAIATMRSGESVHSVVSF